MTNNLYSQVYDFADYTLQLQFKQSKFQFTLLSNKTTFEVIDGIILNPGKTETSRINY